MQKTLLVCWMFAGLMPARAAELKPETAASFDRYIHGFEARMDEDARDNRFLVVDHLPAVPRHEAYGQLQRGQFYIEESDHPAHIPSGLIHHWAGVTFIPEATLSEVLAVFQDYDNYRNIFKPLVRQSALIEHRGNESKIYLQLFYKSLVTVALNAHFEVSDKQFVATRRQSACRSTSIAELANLGKPDEYERPPGDDHGYLWRLYSYWRFEEKDGGVYVQNESVALSRSVPAIFAWLVNPLVKSIPRDILIHLLTATRNAVTKSGTSARLTRQ